MEQRPNMESYEKEYRNFSLSVPQYFSFPLAHVLTGRYWLDLRPGDIHWNLSDTGWAKAAWSSLFGPWHMGATIFHFIKRESLILLRSSGFCRNIR